MTENQKKTNLSALHYAKSALTIALAWLGLAGIADNIVEWQNWFEIGVMEHWRAVKDWLLTYVLGWLPFDVPSIVIDYLLVGTLLSRPLVFSIVKMSHNVEGIGIVALYAISTILWPFYFVFTVMAFFLESDDRHMIREVLYIFIISILGFFPFLFVTSTLLYKFG